jgi:hypothetical protein
MIADCIDRQPPAADARHQSSDSIPAGGFTPGTILIGRYRMSENDPGLAALYASSVRGRIASGPNAGNRVAMPWKYQNEG